MAAEQWGHMHKPQHSARTCVVLGPGLGLAWLVSWVRCLSPLRKVLSGRVPTPAAPSLPAALKTWTIATT